MTDQSEREVVELLRRIEANQRQALAAQQEHVALAKAQYERSESTIQEGIVLQRVAVARQSQIRNVVFPVVVLLVVLLVWLLFRWRMLF